MADDIIDIPSPRLLRDAKIQNELTRRLRSASVDQQRETIRRLMVADLHAALSIARRVLRSPDQQKDIVMFGMETANRSTIKDYLEHGKATMGLLRTLDVVRLFSGQTSEAVEGARYWLPGLANDDAERALISELLHHLAGTRTQG